MTNPTPTTVIESAEGVRLTTADGGVLIDAMSSWWCAIHGYRHPVIDEAIRRQTASMAHVMFGGLTHRPAVNLAEQLVDLTPSALQHVFFADSGSVSVEVALKMAVQYQRGRGKPQRTRLLALRGGYHGDTAGAMSVSDPVGGMHSMFAAILPLQLFAERPPAGIGADTTAWEQRTRQLVSRHAHELAGIICEPVLQGAGGMHIYDPSCLAVLRDLADEHHLVLIFDEIATGFGRTGEFFAAHHADVSPDIMCVGKALTGGYLTLAATLCTTDVAHTISASDAGVLMHGPTFMANPLACAAASASLSLLAAGDWRDDVGRIERHLSRGLAAARALPHVVDVRTLGAVGVIQLDHLVDVVAASRAAISLGVWLRPFRDLIYTMPPYLTDNADLATICGAMVAAVSSASHEASCENGDRAGTPSPTRRTSIARFNAGDNGGPPPEGRTPGGRGYHWSAPEGRLSEWLAARSEDRVRAGLQRRLDPREPAGELVDLASNDYLGLTHDIRVKQAAADAVLVWGAGATASRLVTGSLVLHAELEAALASFTGHAAALIFSTGYQANLGVVAGLADSDTLIVSDAHVHASLVDGCRLARAGGLEIVPHSDLQAVRAALRSRSQRRAMVLVESVYSVLGDAAPLAELAELVERYDGMLVVDEAHAIGVAGRGGRGLVSQAGLSGREDVVTTVTLSKALASQGGAVLGSAAVIDDLVNTARPFIYDTGLAPGAAAAALAALQIVQVEPALPGRALELSARLAAGVGASIPAGAVLSVPMAGPEQAVHAQAQLAAAGYRVGCFRPPSVPDRTSRLRLTARATLTNAQVDQVATSVAALMSPR